LQLCAHAGLSCEENYFDGLASRSNDCRFFTGIWHREVDLVKEEAHYEKNPDFIYRKIVDEAILVPIHQDVADMDCIYTLNGIGAFIWEHLDQPSTQTELKAQVMSEYDADPEVLVADLERFLSEMTALGAIRRV